MPDNENQDYFILPSSVAQPTDIGQILHELSLIDEHLNQETIKDPEKSIDVQASAKLKEILDVNRVDINDPRQRANLTFQLEHIKGNAPRVNISFASNAEGNFLEKITEWFRREVDPYCLLVVGLGPNIGVGSVVRTNNKVFDFSLRNRLKYSSDLLLKEINKAINKETA